MIAKNVAGQGIYLFAKDTTTGAGKAGDAVNISVYITKEGGGTLSATNSVIDVGGGIYWLDFTQSETDANMIAVYAVSITADVVIDPVIFPTDRSVVPSSAVPGANGGLPTVDGNNRVAGVQSAVNITSDGSSIAMSAAGVVATVNVVNTCSVNSDMRGTDGANTVTPPSASTIATEVDSALSTAHGGDSWITASGFSTHSANDVWTVTTRTITGGTISTVGDKSGYSLTTAEHDTIVGKVWDELSADHTVVGSFGYYVDGQGSRVVDLLESDHYIDTAPTPWARVLMKQGTGGIGVGTELLRQQLYDENGSLVTNIETFVGRSVQ